MTNIIDKYYNKVQDILLKGNSSDFDNDEYSHIVNNLEERYYKYSKNLELVYVD